MLYSPLEQFSILTMIPIYYGNIFVSFTNSASIQAAFVATAFYYYYMMTLEGGNLVPSRWQTISEMLYTFVLDMLSGQVGDKGRNYYPFIYVLFTFVLFANLTGMVPYSFTITSHIVVTFALSFMLFIGVTIIGFQIHGMHFFSFFFPPGAPLAMAPLLVVLEVISYVFRPISLGVRLFANMMAGHTLVKIIAGFAWTMMCAGGFLAIASLIPMGVIFALTGLELGVAALQAYVFTILTCIYLNDAIQLH